MYACNAPLSSARSLACSPARNFIALAPPPPRLRCCSSSCSTYRRGRRTTTRFARPLASQTPATWLSVGDWNRGQSMRTNDESHQRCLWFCERSRWAVVSSNAPARTCYTKGLRWHDRRKENIHRGRASTHLFDSIDHPQGIYCWWRSACCSRRAVTLADESKQPLNPRVPTAEQLPAARRRRPSGRREMADQRTAVIQAISVGFGRVRLSVHPLPPTTQPHTHVSPAPERAAEALGLPSRRLPRPLADGASLWIVDRTGMLARPHSIRHVPWVKYRRPGSASRRCIQPQVKSKKHTKGSIDSAVSNHHIHVIPQSTAASAP